MSGASYSNISLIPSKTLDNTLILFSDSAGGLWTVTPSGKMNFISQWGFPALCATFTNDGHILCDAIDPLASQAYVSECNYDGSNFAPVITTSAAASSVGISSNAGKVAWVDSGGSLHVSNFNGSSETTITGLSTFPNLNYNKVAYEQFNASEYQQILTAYASGGTGSLWPGQSSTSNNRNPAWLSFYQIIFDWDNGSRRGIEVLDNNGLVDTSVTQPSGVTDDEQPAPGPDGRSIAWMRGTYNGVLSLVTGTYNGGNVQTLVSGSSSFQIGLPQWSPYFGTQTFVGAGGTMFTSSAAGFLWGQDGDEFSSLVSFTASNPSSATVVPETSSATGADLVFDIHANSLTGLMFTNCYYGQVNTVIPGQSSSVTDVLISFNSSTGQVDTIAPFVSNRGAAKPAVQGGDLVFDARFSGVWNGKGKNVAPNGASQLAIDGSTGKLAAMN